MKDESTNLGGPAASASNAPSRPAAGVVRRLHVVHHPGRGAVLPSFSRRHLRGLLSGSLRLSIRYRDFLGWDMPWYSAHASLDALLVGRQEECSSTPSAASAGSSSPGCTPDAELDLPGPGAEGPDILQGLGPGRRTPNFAPDGSRRPAQTRLRTAVGRHLRARRKARGATVRWASGTPRSASCLTRPPRPTV